MATTYLRTDVRLVLYFIMTAVLDFHNLHQMSLVLSEAGLASDAAFTVKEHFSTTPGLNTLPEVCMHTIHDMNVFINARVLDFLFKFIFVFASYSEGYPRS